MPSRDHAEIVVHHRHDIGKGLFFAFAPSREHPGNVQLILWHRYRVDSIASKDLGAVTVFRAVSRYWDERC
jgi:hypothetical protein